MIKRAALARALALDPLLLFLDEPTSGLDPISAAAFDELVIYLQRELTLTVVMITHDLDTIFRTCSRVGVIVDGRMISDTLEGIVRHPHPWIQAYFQGERARMRGRQTWNVKPTTSRSAPSCCWCIVMGVLFVYWYSDSREHRALRALRDLFRRQRQRPVGGRAGALPGRGRRPRGSASASTSAPPIACRSIADIDATTPISDRTLAQLSLQGVTGLLYIDLQQQRAGEHRAAHSGRSAERAAIR